MYLNKFWIPSFGRPQCNKCGRIIYKDAQLRKRLWTFAGRPICTGCLLLNNPKRGKIDYKRVLKTLQEKQRFRDDIKNRKVFEKIKMEKERKRVEDIAFASQRRAESIDKNTKLIK